MNAATLRPRLGLALALLAPALAGVHAGLQAVAPPAQIPYCNGYDGIPRQPTGHVGMVQLPGGRFRMGSNDAYPEEGPAADTRVGAFWIDVHPVTNAQFRRFVEATGYVTMAERSPAGPASVGSAVFIQPGGAQPGGWRYVPGANWRHPGGPRTNLTGLNDHPVVQIAYEDALAYAHWLGHDLPTEAEWEYAARGGLAANTYVWGNDLHPSGRQMANTWQGPFPFHNTQEDGYAGTSPVGCYAANGFGLLDMGGNVWQWTASWYRPGHRASAEGLVMPVPAGQSEDPRQPGVPVRVIKGGSHLCSPDYCVRYRPAARQPQDPQGATSHIGFRTVLRESGQHS